MEIVKKAKAAHTFRVVKSIHWAGSVKGAGEEIEISNPAEAFGLVQTGKIIPADLPATAEYVALAPLRLPGNTKAHECKKMEKIILRDEQALKLMIEGAVIPIDDLQWRPLDRRLKR